MGAAAGAKKSGSTLLSGSKARQFVATVLGKDVFFYVKQCNVRSQKADGKLGAEQILNVDHPLLTHEKDGMTFVLPRPR